MPSPAELFSLARRRRDPLRADGATDALRLLDGAGDGAAFDGLFIDDFAGRWMVQTARPGQRPPDWLRDVDPAPRRSIGNNSIPASSTNALPSTGRVSR